MVDLHDVEETVVTHQRFSGRNKFPDDFREPHEIYKRKKKVEKHLT
jgi:hypothetical protein